MSTDTNTPTKPSMREKLLSRKFGAAIAIFISSSLVLMYLVMIQCHTPEGFNFGSALSYFDSWGEINLWNAAIFGGADVLEKAAPYMKKKNPVTNE